MPTLSRIFSVSRVTLGIALGLTFFTIATHAEGVVVLPEQLSLSAVKPVADLQVQNPSAEETTVHFAVSSWRQEGDREHLTPDRRLIVHPETIRLRAGESARVRVGLKLSGPRWDEEAFQVLISETPPMPNVGAASSAPTGRRTIQRERVPVFLLPAGDASPRMTWYFERSSDGSVVLRARNYGRGHFRLSSASLLGPNGQSMFKGNLSDILLPGGSRTWEWGANAAPGMWLLTAETNAGPMRVELELGPGLAPGSALTMGN